MAHNRIPRALYEHPIVEYIPLEVATVAAGPVPPAIRTTGAGVRPVLLALNSEDAWTSAASVHRYAVPNLPVAPPTGSRDLALLAIGFRAAAGIYRGRKVSLATAAVGPVYHLFTLPLKYFYKSPIDFVAYTALGARLAEARAVDIGPRPSRAPAG